MQQITCVATYGEDRPGSLQEWQVALQKNIELKLAKSLIELILVARASGLVDMDGDGKADHVWACPKTGELIVWLNRPSPSKQDGYQQVQMAKLKFAVTPSRVGPAETVYLADTNGSDKADYYIVNFKTATVVCVVELGTISFLGVQKAIRRR